MYSKLLIFATVFVLSYTVAYAQETTEAVSVEACKEYMHRSLEFNLRKWDRNIDRAKQNLDHTCETSYDIRVNLKRRFADMCLDWCVKNQGEEDLLELCLRHCRNATYDPRYVILKKTRPVHRPSNRDFAKQ